MPNSTKTKMLLCTNEESDDRFGEGPRCHVAAAVKSVHYVMLQSMIFFHCMLVIGMAGPRSTKLLGEDKLMLLHFWCKKQKGPVLLPTHSQ